MKKFLLFAVSATLLMPLVVAAQAGNPCTDPSGGNLGECVSQIYLWSLGISGLLAVAVAVWGGYLVMTARGNAAASTKGKNYIYSALAGMILLAGAYILLNTINTDLTDFTSPDKILEDAEQEAR
jgi:hypothetical protein